MAKELVGTGNFDVVGLDRDGCVICQNRQTGERYNTGETPTEFGLTAQERERLDEQDGEAQRRRS